MSRIWVVEINVGRKWEPTVGVKLTRQEGRWCLADWQKRNRDDTFRLVQYSRIEMHRARSLGGRK